MEMDPYPESPSGSDGGPPNSPDPLLPASSKTLHNGCQQTQTKKEIVVDHSLLSPLLFRVNQIPDAFVLFSVAAQHMLGCLASGLIMSLLMADILCAERNDPIRAVLFCTTLFMSGFCTVLQTLVGVRLPVYQGPSSSFIVPLLTLAKQGAWSCAAPVGSEAANLSTSFNFTVNVTTTVPTEVFTPQEKLQKLSGSLMLAACFEVLIGMLGIVGTLMRFVGPITVGTTIALIGLSLVKVPLIYSPPSWPLSATTCGLILLFSLVLNRIRIPVPSPPCCKSKGPTPRSVPVFQLIPILLALLLAWMLSAILTAANVFSSDPTAPDFLARSDAKAEVITQTPWFFFPYPGQFGAPGFSAAAFVGFLAAFMSSIIESVGDYCATARACQVPVPTRQALARGIMMEGLGSVVSGAVGAGHATTSFSGNIAIISLTQVASRSVMVVAGVLQIIVSLIGKFGAALATVPTPVLGGIQLATLGMLISIGVSTLSHANLSASRNLVIIGISFFVGIGVPQYIQSTPRAIWTGNEEADQVLGVILGTPMFIGGITAFFLDNLVYGTAEDRGTGAFQNNCDEDTLQTGQMSTEEVYGSRLVKKFQRKLPWLNRMPFLPHYRRSSQTSCHQDQKAALHNQDCSYRDNHSGCSHTDRLSKDCNSNPA